MVGHRALEREHRADARAAEAATISRTISGASSGTSIGRLRRADLRVAERVGLELLPERQRRGARLLVEVVRRLMCRTMSCTWMSKLRGLRFSSFTRGTSTGR